MWDMSVYVWSITGKGSNRGTRNVYDDTKSKCIFMIAIFVKEIAMIYLFYIF